MSAPLHEELKAVLGIRRVRLQRAETALVKAHQAERRSAEDVVSREEQAKRVEEENRKQEAELALELFNRQTVMSHIASFRTQVAKLREGVSQARGAVEEARQSLKEAKVRTREAVGVQRDAYRAVEKLEFSLSELAGEQRVGEDDE